MKENGGAERPGHVAGELERNSGEGEQLGAQQCRLTCARQWPRRWRLVDDVGFGSNLIHWIELHEFYKFAYKIKA